MKLRIEVDENAHGFSAYLKVPAEVLKVFPDAPASLNTFKPYSVRGARELAVRNVVANMLGALADSLANAVPDPERPIADHQVIEFEVVPMPRLLGQGARP